MGTKREAKLTDMRTLALATRLVLQLISVRW